MSPMYTLKLLFVAFFAANASSCIEPGECQTTSALSRAVSVAPNRQPAIPRPQQDEEAEGKLADFTSNGVRPNFVWLVVDDLGYGDVGGLWGGGARIGAATPNINFLSEHGLSLMATYSQLTCTPTRAAMMTGRLPLRTGLTRPILAGDTVTGDPWANESSIAKQLSDAGYYTILTGKWHCGENVGSRPTDVGFDEFQGYYTSQKEITQKFDRRRYPDLVLNEELYASFGQISDHLDMYHQKKGEEETVKNVTESIEQFAEADQTLAKFTIEKIKYHALQPEPFFIAHNFMRVHADNHPSAEFLGKSASKFQFKDNVVEVDAIVGEIIKALNESKVLNNTFVFFTSDNGPQMDSWPDSGHTPFRGGKATTWEGGVRVPGIAYWPGMIKPRVSDELFDLLDLYNTMLHMAGVDMEANLAELPLDVYVDGIDQMSFLLHDDGHSKREHIYNWAVTDFMAMRMREYKYHMQLMQGQNELQLIDFSTHVSVGYAPWLYNLYIDPKESMPVGHRRNAWLATMGSEAKLHIKTFQAYPPKDVGLTVP